MSWRRAKTHKKQPDAVDTRQANYKYPTKTGAAACLLTLHHAAVAVCRQARLSRRSTPVAALFSRRSSDSRQGGARRSLVVGLLPRQGGMVSAVVRDTGFAHGGTAAPGLFPARRRTRTTHATGILSPGATTSATAGFSATRWWAATQRLCRIWTAARLSAATAETGLPRPRTSPVRTGRSFCGVGTHECRNFGD